MYFIHDVIIFFVISLIIIIKQISILHCSLTEGNLYPYFKVTAYYYRISQHYRGKILLIVSRVGVIKIVINCNFITFSKVNSYNCHLAISLITVEDKNTESTCNVINYSV